MEAIFVPFLARPAQVLRHQRHVREAWKQSVDHVIYLTSPSGRSGVALLRHPFNVKVQEGYLPLDFGGSDQSLHVPILIRHRHIEGPKGFERPKAAKEPVARMLKHYKEPVSARIVKAYLLGLAAFGTRIPEPMAKYCSGLYPQEIQGSTQSPRGGV